MNYKDLIDRLREDANEFEINSAWEAADVIESLISAGPVAWMYEWTGPDPKEVAQFRSNKSEGFMKEFWKEAPLYFIPIPEVKE